MYLTPLPNPNIGTQHLSTVAPLANAPTNVPLYFMHMGISYQFIIYFEHGEQHGSMGLDA